MPKPCLYLVSGGAGFIGSHIAEALLRRGCSVRILDNFSSGRRANLDTLRAIGGARLDVMRGELGELKTVRRAVRGTSYVFHQAALPSVIRSVQDPILTHEVNVNGTLNILVASRDAGVKRFVFASSSSVYGDSPRLPKRETDASCPRSPYAASKLAGEIYCKVFYGLYGLETIALRYFNVYGPRQDPKSEYAAVIPRFVTAMLAGRRPVIFGDGEQSRDFTYVTDAVQANLKACRAPASACGRVYNVARGRRTSLLELLNELGRILGMMPRVQFKARRKGDVMHSLAAIRMAKRCLRYAPRVDLGEGLERTIRFLKDEGTEAR